MFMLLAGIGPAPSEDQISDEPVMTKYPGSGFNPPFKFK
jgi:hypothetical protein